LTFARADSFHRRTEAVVSPGLDLHDHELRPATADEVQLAAPGSEASPDHLIAASLEEVGGRLLSSAAEL
jgi:hypothetical protein